jgi:hypothetical protein
MDEVELDRGRSFGRRVRGFLRGAFLVVGIVSLALVLLFWGFTKWRHHQPPSASSIATQAGADSCTTTGFYITDQLSGEKDDLFDCSFPDGSEKCVIRSHGLTRDATAEAKALFASQLGTTTPLCAE